MADQAVSSAVKVQARKFKFENEYLFRQVNDRFVKIPYIHERQDIIQRNHDGHAHFGRESTWLPLYQYYWWPGAYEEVKKYLCKECQLFDKTPAKNAKCI